MHLQLVKYIPLSRSDLTAVILQALWYTLVHDVD